jgi:hypothetical protein
MTSASTKWTPIDVIVRALTMSLLLALTSTQAAAQGDVATDNTPQNGINSTLGWQTEYQDNVFRTAEQSVSDIVSTLSTAVSARGRMKALALTASGEAEWMHFDTLVKQRGANGATSVKLDFLLNRLAPYMTATYRNTRRRVNPEIDIRPRVTGTTFGLGSVLRMGGKTDLDFSAEHRTEAYDRVFVDDVNLRNALTQTSNQFRVSLRHTVTPLTRVSVTSDISRHEFDTSYRTTDQIRLTAGFESDGRVRGYVRAGMQMINPRDPSLKPQQGLVVSVGTTATVHDSLQVGVTAERDVAPSYRDGIAYYDSTVLGGSITYAMLRSVRLGVGAHRRVADYKAGIGISALAAELAGIDRETQYQSVIRYLIGESLAIDVSGAYADRTSISALRRFDSATFTVGVSHAF